MVVRFNIFFIFSRKFKSLQDTTKKMNRKITNTSFAIHLILQQEMPVITRSQARKQQERQARKQQKQQEQERQAREQQEQERRQEQERQAREQQQQIDRLSISVRQQREEMLERFRRKQEEQKKIEEDNLNHCIIQFGSDLLQYSQDNYDALHAMADHDSIDRHTFASYLSKLTEGLYNVNQLGLNKCASKEQMLEYFMRRNRYILNELSTKRDNVRRTASMNAEHKEFERKRLEADRMRAIEINNMNNRKI